MKRVGVLTFLWNGNYGSALQAYALQRTLRDLGVDCEHFNYQPDSAEKAWNLIRSHNSPKLILEGLKKKDVTRRRAEDREKRAAIRGFYDRRMQLSPPCRNGRDLKRIGKQYDLLLCGSDQIWNPVWLNPAYFLEFAPREVPRVAYAASLGVQEMPSRSKARRMARLVRGFSAISVREAEGAALMERITGQQTDVMPDPVCLLSREEWLELADHAEGQEEPCLLCYFIGENPAYWTRVRELSESAGLKVRVIPVTAEGYESGYPLMAGLSPEGFVRAISRAALLVTDSFHGLVFATVLNRPAEVLQRDRPEDPERKTSRVDHFRRLMERQTPAALREQGRKWLSDRLEELLPE